MVDKEVNSVPHYSYTVRLDVRCVRAFHVLKDKRIATMKSDTTLNILDTKQKCKIVSKSAPYLKPSPFKEFLKGHLSELDNGHLIANFMQNEMVFFSVNNDKIEKVGSITNDYFVKDVFSLTPLSNNRFATLKGNKISIWKGDAPYQNEPIKEIDFGEKEVYDLLRLEGTDTLIIKMKENVKIYNMENYSETASIVRGSTGGNAFFQYDDTKVIMGSCILDVSAKTITSFYHESDDEEANNFVSGVKLRNGYIQMDNNCYITDNSRCECYTNYYSHIINPITGEGNYVNVNGEGLRYWTTIDDNMVVGINLDKMKVYTYED